MNPKFLGILAFAVFLAIGLYAYRIENPNQTTLQEKPSLVYDHTMTLGNHSYVPINRSGRPADNVEFVLKTLKEFEDAHPELEIVNKQIEKQQRSGQGSIYPASDYIFGIWVDTRPRVQEAERSTGK